MLDSSARLLVVGQDGGTHVGGSFLRAAATLGIAARLSDSSLAFRAPRLLRTMSWRLMGHRPPLLGRFSRIVEREVRRTPPTIVLAMGIAPLDARALRSLGASGARRGVFLTDDPWSAAHRSAWFLESLREYDVVFTPRTANAAELAAVSRQVEVLPFAYDPSLSFRPPAVRPDAGHDVVFIGTGDGDRIPYIERLLTLPIDFGLYGNLWRASSAASRALRPTLDPAAMRLAIAEAKIALCLVRRANRDGHVMRTFETLAVGACMLTEDTPEHRALLGEDLERVAYFRDPDEMAAKVRLLLADKALRHRLAQAGQAWVTTSGHTYADRLRTIVTKLT